MTRRVAKFEKVSTTRYLHDWFDTNGKPSDLTNEQIVMQKIITTNSNIKIPERATIGSAGYDFFAPESFELKPGETIKIPTGIKVKMDDDYVLQIYPRSGLGFKYRLQLDNTVGIIDSDYYYSDNEGHIFIKITNDSNENKSFIVKSGEAFAQGIFVPYGITYDDKVTEIRNGGMGSTDKN